MKLYATAKNSKGKTGGTGDNSRVSIELKNGNNVFGELLYSYNDRTGELSLVFTHYFFGKWHKREVLKQFENVKV